MRSHHYYIIILSMLLSLTGCQSKGDKVIGSGSFEATEILVSSEVDGKVLEWDVEEGMRLKEGRQVGVIDTLQLYLQKESLLRSGQSVRANRPNIETQTKALEVQLSNLMADKERIARLLQSGASTQRELDQVNTSINALKSQIAASRSTLANQSSQITAQSSAIDVQVAQVEDLIARSLIHTPIAGTVTANYIHQGELAGQGRPLFKIADLSQLYLRAYVQNDQLARIKIGDEVKVQVDGAEGSKVQYTGTICWISSRSEFTPKTVQTEEERSNLVYAVKVKVPNDGYLRIGMYGEIVSE